MEGWATRGKFSVEVAYVRQYWLCKPLNGRYSADWDDNLYVETRRWHVKVVEALAIIMLLLKHALQAKDVRASQDPDIASALLPSSGPGRATFPKA